MAKSVPGDDLFLRSDGIYSLAEAARRLGVSSGFLKQAGTRGLKLGKIGSKTFLQGRDLAAFLRLEPSNPATVAEGQDVQRADG